MSGVFHYFLSLFQGKIWVCFLTEWQHWLYVGLVESRDGE